MTLNKQMLKGHLDVWPDYVIPDEDPWPLPIQGQPVGFLVNVIRAQKDLLMKHYPDRWVIVDLCGFAVRVFDERFSGTLLCKSRTNTW